MVFLFCLLTFYRALLFFILPLLQSNYLTGCLTWVEYPPRVLTSSPVCWTASAQDMGRSMCRQLAGCHSRQTQSTAGCWQHPLVRHHEEHPKLHSWRWHCFWTTGFHPDLQRLEPKPCNTITLHKNTRSGKRLIDNLMYAHTCISKSGRTCTIRVR